MLFLFWLQRESQRDNMSLKLQMQQLYTAIRDVSGQLRRDWSLDEDVDLELELDLEVSGCTEQSSTMLQVSSHEQQQRHTFAAADDDSVFHSGTMTAISGNRVGLEAGDDNWCQDLLEIRFAKFTPRDHATNAANHWTGSCFRQIMTVS